MEWGGTPKGCIESKGLQEEGSIEAAPTILLGLSTLELFPIHNPRSLDNTHRDLKANTVRVWGETLQNNPPPKLSARPHTLFTLIPLLCFSLSLLNTHIQILNAAPSPKPTWNRHDQGNDDVIIAPSLSISPGWQFLERVFKTSKVGFLFSGVSWRGECECVWVFNRQGVDSDTNQSCYPLIVCVKDSEMRNCRIHRQHFSKTWQVQLTSIPWSRNSYIFTYWGYSFKLKQKSCHRWAAYSWTI